MEETTRIPPADITGLNAIRNPHKLERLGEVVELRR